MVVWLARGHRGLQEEAAVTVTRMARCGEDRSRLANEVARLEDGRVPDDKENEGMVW